MRRDDPPLPVAPARPSALSETVTKVRDTLGALHQVRTDVGALHVEMGRLRRWVIVLAIALGLNVVLTGVVLLVVLVVLLARP